MYRIIRSILFCFSAETAHKLTCRLISLLKYIPFARHIARLCFEYRSPSLEREVFGIKFKNPVGFAAGFDKDGDYYNDMASFGFGFIEIGSLTPEPQPGNPKPRLFRIPKDKALVNRMGINNNGVKYAVNRLQKDPPRIIVGGNIAKCSKTPNEDAGMDYEKAFSYLYDYVDFFVINVSCPNVKDLTRLQSVESTADIIDRLLALRRYYDDYRPILLKVSPDIPKESLDSLLDLMLISGIDGVVATNTTRTRDGLTIGDDEVKAIGEGGMSGAPLFSKSIEFVKYIHEKTGGILPIIGVGGITTPQQAKEMLDAGASLIEIYSGYIYNGPSFVKQILKQL